MDSILRKHGINITMFEDDIRVILEENARIWGYEPPMNLRSIFDGIKLSLAKQLDKELPPSQKPGRK